MTEQLRETHVSPEINNDDLQLKTMDAKYFRHRIAQETALFHSIHLKSNANIWLTEKYFEAGDIVFRQGDKPDYLYLVLSGTAAIFKENKSYETFLSYIGNGGFFGELALINDEPRSATVRAKTQLSTLVLSGENFKLLYFKSKDLQCHLDNLSTIYRLPNRGLVTMHTSKLLGHSATTAIFHNAQGPQVAFSCAVDESIFSISTIILTNKPRTKKIRFEDDANGIQRELIVSNDGHVLNATCVGPWLDLGYLLNTIFADRRLQKRQLALFRLEGDLRLEREELDSNNESIICQCVAVSRSSLKKCINSGFNTVSDVSDETGAGKVCGSCIPLITDMLGRTDMMLVTFVGAASLAKNITSFRFQPNKGKLESANPTQHIVIKARIDSQWVRRSYTLTSPADDRESFEIIVKKEDGGLFSNWLHDTMTHEDIIRVSKPKGGYNLSHNVDVPYVFFMAGVGVTPVLSYLRSAKNMSAHELERHVFVDISSTTKSRLICFNELAEIAEKNKNLSINYHCTRESGHLKPDDINCIVASHPQAVYFICGPTAYQTMVKSTLLQAGVVEKNIQVESFLEHHAEISQAEKVEKARSQHQGHRPAYIFSLLAMLTVALVVILPEIYLLKTVQEKTLSQFLLTDKIMRQVTGYAILGCIALSLLFSLRKRVNFVSVGRFTWWRLTHLFLGLLALVGLFFHTGLSLGNNLNFYLSALLLLLALLGAISMLLKIKADQHLSTALAEIHDRMKCWHIGLAFFFPALLLAHILSGYYF